MLRPNPRWRVGIKAENLFSYLHIGTLQQIESRVLVNRPTPDPDGFLHAPPVLEGQTRTRSLRAHAATHYHGIIAYRQSSSIGALMFTYDFRWRAGVAFARTGSIERWGILWLEPMEWQLGFRTEHWELSVGFDRLNWSLAKRLRVRMQWSLPL